MSGNNDFVQKLLFDDYVYVSDLNIRSVKCEIDSMDKAFYKIVSKRDFKPEKYFLLVSDTHDDTNYIHNLVHALNKNGIKNLIHCGDICDPGTLSKFREFNGRVSGVLGNHDKKNAGVLKLVCDKHNFNFGYDILRINSGGKKIVATHGDDVNLQNRVTDHERFNFMVFGHTHRRLLLWNKKQGRFIINAGAYFDDPLPSDPDDSIPSFVLFPVTTTDPRDIIYFMVKNNGKR